MHFTPTGKPVVIGCLESAATVVPLLGWPLFSRTPFGHLAATGRANDELEWCPQFWPSLVHITWVHPPFSAISSRSRRTVCTSGRFSAFCSQHILAISQTGVIPRSSMIWGFDGRMPFETLTITVASSNPGKGIFPVASWRQLIRSIRTWVNHAFGNGRASTMTINKE